MGVGQIGDVNVVADAGAVRGLIIVAKDGNTGPAAQGDIEDQGNQVSLRLVDLADFAVRIGAVRIPLLSAP